MENCRSRRQPTNSSAHDFLNNIRRSKESIVDPGELCKSRWRTTCLLKPKRRFLSFEKFRNANRAPRKQSLDIRIPFPVEGNHDGFGSTSGTTVLPLRGRL